MNADNAEGKPGLKERFWEEMRAFGILSAYLFVCFSVLLMYESTVQGSDNATPVHYGMALVQALVIGKFLLIGKVIGVGKNTSGRTLMRRVAWRTLAFLLVLIVFKILEELIVGWFKDVSFAKTLAELADKDPVAIIAPILVMTLLLIPLAAFVELERAIGSEQFSRIIRGQD